MYGKLVEGVLQTPPEDINKSIQKMKDAGYKPVIDSKPGYDVDTQDAIFTGYVDTGRYIRAMYAIEEIEPTEEELYIEQTDKAMEMLSVNLSALLPNLTDEQALEVPLMFPKWQEGNDYNIGDRILYQNVLYKVLQAHTSQATWEPDVAPSLFAKVLIPDPDIIPEWEQPDSTNPYMTGDKVMFEGKVYISIMDNNVWSPTDYPQGWEEVVENNMEE